MNLPRVPDDGSPFPEFVAATWDYFAKTHGRRGWDGKNKGVHATVHYGPRYDNAFFDGKQLVYGDGDGSDFSPLAGGLGKTLVGVEDGDVIDMASRMAEVAQFVLDQEGIR